MRIVIPLLFGACAVTSQQAQEVDAGGAADGSAAANGVPDVRCTGAPAAGPAAEFRHVKSQIIAALGDPRHRGVDLIASASSGTQAIEGWLAYTIGDKALEDEDVELFACRDRTWTTLGTARSDGDGHFSLVLAGAERLPIGLRDLYLSVVGDRSGASFLGYVAPRATALLVSDVDGTLTSSEHAFIETAAGGEEPGAQPGAAAAFTAMAASGIQPVYLTARGTQYTGATRTWLAANGFPRGPLRLAASFITLPGEDTVEFKRGALDAIEAAGLVPVIGVGNRASDITAYAAAGIASDRTFIKLPEFQSEVQAALDAGQAVGIASYDQLAPPLR